MDRKPFEKLKKNVQEIIDLIAEKNTLGANKKLAATTEALDELLDHAATDEEVREISRYQVLLQQLHQKINAV